MAAEDSNAVSEKNPLGLVFLRELLKNSDSLPFIANVALRHIAKFRENLFTDGKESSENNKLAIKHNGRSLLHTVDHNFGIALQLPV